MGLQSIRATSSSVNYTLKEFIKYIKNIRVSDVYKDIQETASEVINKMSF